MIPTQNIVAWSKVAPWAEPRQVEQDLIIARALVELFSDPFLSKELRFRGGTALNKLHFPKPLRYSEDIDLTRTKEGASKPIWDRVHDLLDPWLGDPEYLRSPVAPALRYSVGAEDGSSTIRLKIEINEVEITSLDPTGSVPFKVDIERHKDLRRSLPGLALALVIAVLAISIRRIPALAMVSPLMIAILAGILVGNFYRLPAQFEVGLSFSSRGILRCAIGLLGLQLSVTQIVAIGIDVIVIVVCTVAIAFIGIGWLGRLLRVDPKLSDLVAAGTSICGASAIAAMSTVNQASEEDVAYSMGVVTALGTLLMFLLPVAAHFLDLDARAFGIWAGASIHEVAQVTGAAFQFSNAAGETSVVVKLMRVLMLAPLILVCGLWSRNRLSIKTEGASKPRFPLFVIGFIAAVILSSTVTIASDMRASLMLITTFLMSVALAALGLQIDISKLKGKGIRPLALGMLGAMLVVMLSLGLLLMAGHLN